MEISNFGVTERNLEQKERDKNSVLSEYLKSVAGHETETFVAKYPDVVDKDTCEQIIKEVDDLWDKLELEINSDEWNSTNKWLDECFNNGIIYEVKEMGLNRGRQGIEESNIPLNEFPHSRQDRALFIDNPYYSPSIRKFNDWLQICLELYTKKFGISHRLESRTNKIHQVEPFHNGYAALHYEQADGNTSKRNITWLLYLTDVETGGETEMAAYGIRVPPKVGTSIFFPAAYTHLHRGLVPHQRKCYITGWFECIE